MKVFKQPRIIKEELPEAPNWITRVLDPLNLFFQQIWSLCQTLTIGDNVIGKWQTLTIKTSATYSSGDFPDTTFQWTFGKPVEGLFVAQVRKQGSSTINTLPTSVDWEQTNSTIRVKYIAGLDDSTTYTVRVLAL